MSEIKSGKHIHSDSRAYLEGVERGIAMVNSPLVSHGIEDSPEPLYDLMLVIEDPTTDIIHNEYSSN